MDFETKEITLTTEGEDDRFIQRILRVDSSALLSSGGKPIRFDDLKLGCILRLRLDETGKCVRALIANLPGREEDQLNGGNADE